MTEKEFISNIKKAKGQKKHKITHSYGMKEASRYYMKKCKKFDEKIFRKVIRLINLLLQKEVSEGNDIHFPHRMGFLEIRKFKTEVSFIDGKVITNRPIDWNETNKLWYEDEEARNKKQFVRREVPYVFRIYYKRATVNCKNKEFIEFLPNRNLKLALKKNIDNNKVDAFILNNVKVWNINQ